MSDAPARLSVRGLKKKYKHARILNGVSLQVERNEVVGLLGANGAGKTTCFNAIIGLLQVDAGRIFLGDEDITALPMHIRARRGIGYLPQEHSVFRKLTTEENLLAVLEISRDYDAEARAEISRNLLQEFDLHRIKDRPTIQLSGGEQRRVEIARALALSPAFVLLDEPFAGVDPIAVRDIRGIVGELKRRDIGVLITDHNVRETLGICDRAYILHQGRVLADGAPETLMENAEVREAYLGEDFRL